MKQDRLFLTAGFMPAVVMAAFLLLESLRQNGVLPQNIWILAAAEVAVYLVPMAVLRFLRGLPPKPSLLFERNPL